MLISMVVMCLLLGLSGCKCWWNRAPVAIIAASPTSGYVPLSVTFSASNSYDPDGHISTYRWDFGDGSGADGIQTTHMYHTAGDFTATLLVTDDCNARATTSVAISAIEALPIFINLAGNWEITDYWPDGGIRFRFIRVVWLGGTTLLCEWISQVFSIGPVEVGSCEIAVQGERVTIVLTVDGIPQYDENGNQIGVFDAVCTYTGYMTDSNHMEGSLTEELVKPETGEILWQGQATWDAVKEGYGGE